MARSIVLTKSSSVIKVAVDGGVPRTLTHINNITVKPIGTTGCVVKLTDETWRLKVFLADTVTKDAVQSSPYADVTAMIADLAAYFV